MLVTQSGQLSVDIRSASRCERQSMVIAGEEGIEPSLARVWNPPLYR
jgi:hypothetical protein